MDNEKKKIFDENVKEHKLSEAASIRIKVYDLYHFTASSLFLQALLRCRVYDKEMIRFVHNKMKSSIDKLDVKLLDLNAASKEAFTNPAVAAFREKSRNELADVLCQQFYKEIEYWISEYIRRIIDEE